MSNEERIRKITAEMVEHLKAARAIADAAGDRDFTDAERGQVTELMGKAGALKKELDGAKADARTRAAIKDLGDGIGIVDKTDKPQPNGFVIPQGQSVGQHFIGSDEYKGLLATAPGGHFTKEHRVQSRPVGYGRLLPATSGQKALVTGLSDTSGGAFVRNDWLGLQVGLGPFQRPHLRYHDHGHHRICSRHRDHQQRRVRCGSHVLGSADRVRCRPGECGWWRIQAGIGAGHRQGHHAREDHRALDPHHQKGHVRCGANAHSDRQLPLVRS